MNTCFADPAQPFTIVTPDILSDLLAKAKLAPLRRARFCMHADVEHCIHEMVIAFWRGSEVPVHRHREKTESFHVISGEIDVLIFDNAGRLFARHRLSADDPAQPRAMRIQKPVWHTLQVISESAIVHEVTQGPFRHEKMEIAPWLAVSPQDIV